MRLAKVTAFIFICLFACIFILIHFLRPELNYLKSPLSRYAIGNYGRLMSLGFLLFSFSEILLGFNIYKTAGKLKMISIVSFVAGIGVFMATIFQMDLKGTPTTFGYLHFTGAIIQFILFPLLCLYAAREITRGWFKEFSLYISLITLLLFLLLAFSIYLKSDLFFCIVEKLDISIFTIWLLICEYNML